MGIGTGIALIVVGAIASFALNIQVSWLDLDLLGYILMGAGVVVFVVGIVLSTRRRSATLTTRSGVDPVSGEQVTTRTESEDPLA
jgi:hypothetical protein